MFLIAAQNNAIGTNYIKVKIDNKQLKSKWRFRENREKMIYDIIIEYSKLAQKEHKTRHDLGGKLILWELWFQWFTEWK